MEKLLPTIKRPEQLRELQMSELYQLAEEIRRLILTSVAGHGGHLAANLGSVELTIALLYVFGNDRDRIVWDVGHQTYAFKMLTGRAAAFDTLRCFGGLSGFTSPDESDRDVFFSGHAGCAVPAALGLAAARSRRNIPGVVAAVIGDGSLSCGLTIEGMNNIKNAGGRLLTVLNDNKMSIAPNTGAMRNFLNRMITGCNYNSFKTAVKRFLGRFPGSAGLIAAIGRVEAAVKHAILPLAIFESMDLRYVGPVNGHSIEDMIEIFSGAARSPKPMIVHVITRKGRGYPPAEREPEKFHGVGPFDPEREIAATTGRGGFSDAFGRAMCEIAGRDGRLAALTAAMTSGTGLTDYSRRFPERFFDVGIAEGHAVTFAAGLAAGGMRPVVAIYSTFVQRALDNIYHDVVLQKLPVILAIDRAGAVEDGPSHHGIYDLGFLLEMPNLAVMAPADEAELAQMLNLALSLNAPAAIRYPRGASGFAGGRENAAPMELGRAEVVADGEELSLWVMGPELRRALEIRKLVKAETGVNIRVVNARFLAPFDHELLLSDARRMTLATLEDHVVSGGLGSLAARTLAPHGATVRRAFGWPGDRLIMSGAVAELRRACSLDEAAIAGEVVKILKKS